MAMRASSHDAGGGGERADGATDTEAGGTEHTGHTPSVEPIRVLYMEDDAVLARLILLKLRTGPFQVDMARNGAEGLRLFSQSEYDVVAVDYSMPECNGLDVLGQLAQEDAATPVIMVTGSGDEQVAVEAMKWGACDYIIKDRQAAFLKLLPTVLERVVLQRRLEQQKVLAEQRARESEFRLQKLESLRVLAAGVAHDYNNILQAILGNVDLACDELPAESFARAHIQQIRESAERAAALTRQMLDYSGGGVWAGGPVDIRVLFQDVRSHEHVPKHGPVQVQFALPAGLPMIKGDHNQLVQMLVNVVVNGCEAVGRSPGAVAVTAALVDADATFLAGFLLGDELPPGPYVCLSVCDTGSGIDKEAEDRLFEPFFSTKFVGRGLGLAYVLGIARGHGGAVAGENLADGGARFRILLPCAADVSVTPDEALPDLPATPGTGPHPATVLVIDDEAAVRFVIERMLGRAGIRVVGASGGDEGLALYRRHLPQIDAVLLDVTMPRMNGFQVLRELRRIQADVRVILTSGYSEQDTLSGQATGDRPVAFIQKPYTGADLIRIVQQALTSKA